MVSCIASENEVAAHSMEDNPHSIASIKYGGEFGVWVWKSPIQMTPEYVSRMIAPLRAYHFNVIYVTIDDYLAIAALPDGDEKTAAKERYMHALADLVSATRAAGIAVDAEGGAKDWIIEENRFKGYALIDFVAEYNRAYPQAKLRGFQYDVEPYLLSEYETDKKHVLLSFIEFIDASTDRIQHVDAHFSVVIPHFYDAKQAWTPAIAYKGKTQYTYTHLLDILDRKPDSSIIIMAYRNYFSGTDGTYEITEPKIREATDTNRKTRIIVAQETGRTEPASVTFNGHSKAELLSSIESIRTAFGSCQDFGGIAVHYLEPFLRLP